MHHHLTSQPPLPFAPPLEKPPITPILAANGYPKDVGKSNATPWHRTTKGLAIIIVGALVLVAVIVGVAVGVSQSKKSSNASGATLYPTEVAPSTSAATGGSGIATTAPPAASTSAAPNGGGIATTAPPAATTSAATDGGSIATPPPTASPAASTSAAADGNGVSLITRVIVTTRAVAVRS